MPVVDVKILTWCGAAGEDVVEEIDDIGDGNDTIAVDVGYSPR